MRMRMGRGEGSENTTTTLKRRQTHSLAAFTSLVTEAVKWRESEEDTTVTLAAMCMPTETKVS